MNAAKALTYQAILQSDAGDYFGSEETSISALKYLKQPEHNENLLSVYNSIAISRVNLNDYKTALHWYKKALSINKDSLQKTSIQNNIAVVYSKVKYYATSIRILENLLHRKDINEDQKIKEKVIDNLALVRFKQNPAYNAEPELTQADRSTFEAYSRRKSHPGQKIFSHLSVA